MFSFLRIINAGGNQYCGLLFFTMFLGAHGFMISKNFHTGSESRILKKPTSTMRTPVSSLLYRRETMNSTTTLDIPLDRFHRQASTTQEVDEDCILTIENKKYNLTAFGKAHPGGHKILQRFHNRDATKAFEAAHHSSQAYAMLDDFRMVDDTIKTAKKDDINDSVVEINGSNNHAIPIAKTSCPVVLSSVVARTVRNQKQSHPGRLLRRMKHKLFTKEDPIGIHKYLGMFCLLNFIGRYRQMWFGVDPAAGLGSQGHPWFSIACLIPHAMLSLSSLIFHTVPKERVVGKPMIWQEYRVHNIIFGVRSVLSALATAMAIKAGNTPLARKTAVIFVGGLVLLANWGADVATDKLRVSNVESTTATMPYWKGCSLETQRRFKGFYAYCQFMATLACLAVGNPAWPLSVLLAIQMASLLMTLVRKGLLSARGYHYGYTATLIAPWFVGFRSMAYTNSPEFPLVMILGYALYQLRRQGVNKYVLWVPLVLSRFLFGDSVVDFAAW